jgi:adenylate cyclase class 2
MQQSSDHLEIEVKFYLPDVDSVRKRLLKLGATESPECMETNIRFENPERSLKARHQLLRLRKDDGCRLTFKEPPRQTMKEFKVYRELEVRVSDFDTMSSILKALGFEAVQRYDKRRRSYRWKDVTLCIDTMPFGTFLEIEGPQMGIKAVAKTLALPWEERIVSNYLAIFDLLRHRYQLPFEDVTFENFRSYPVNIAPHLPELRAQL